VCAASPPRRTLLRLQPAFNAAAHSVYHDDVRIARAGALAVLLAATAAVAVGAVDLRLDAPAITRALSLGQTAIAADLVRFHQPYRVDVQRAPVDYLEIVTPFRRIVLAAQARAGAGDRRFGQREAIEIEAATPGQIDLYAELTFHPLNTFVLVPAYRMRVRLPSGGWLEPHNVNGMPRYGARVNGGLLPYTPTPLPGGAAPGRAQPMLGATILGSFDGEALAAACNRRCEVVVEEEGKMSVPVPLSLAALR